MEPKCPNDHTFNPMNIEKGLATLVGASNTGDGEYVAPISCKFCGHVYGVLRCDWTGNLL